MMGLFASFLFPRAFLFLAFSAWLAIAVINNIRDRSSNIFLLGVMFRMTLLKEDPNLGNGLKHRAVDNPTFHGFVLTIVVAYEAFMVVALAFAGVSNAAAWFGRPFVDPTAAGNVALVIFGSLWFFFMSGGLWFGYWMKQPQVQQLHMTLVLMTIGIFILVNLPK